MGRGKALSDTEKEKILILKSQGQNPVQIAKNINRGKTVVYNYLNNMERYGKNMKGRKKMATSPKERRKILRIASNSAMSVPKIREKSGVSASLRTVHRILKSCPYIVRRKLQKKPPLNEKRKSQRLQFAKSTMTWSNKWFKVVFSDEKKFNIDGPDGYNYYFHDLNKEELFLNRRHSREGGIMVWGAISYYGTIELVFVSHKMTATTYKNILEEAFPKFNDLFGPIPWTYQHDNAPIHTARAVKQWIHQQGVQFLDWPPYSPDLNPMENVWGWLARKVYEGGKQFETIESLKDAITEAWSSISLNYLESLYNSMPNRIFEVISKNGGSTHY